MGAEVRMEEWWVWGECCGGVGVGKGLCFALTAAFSLSVCAGNYSGEKGMEHLSRELGKLVGLQSLNLYGAYGGRGTSDAE